MLSYLTEDLFLNVMHMYVSLCGFMYMLYICMCLCGFMYMYVSVWFMYMYMYVSLWFYVHVSGGTTTPCLGTICLIGKKPPNHRIREIGLIQRNQINPQILSTELGSRHGLNILDFIGKLNENHGEVTNMEYEQRNGSNTRKRTILK